MGASCVSFEKLQKSVGKHTRERHAAKKTKTELGINSSLFRQERGRRDSRRRAKGSKGQKGRKKDKNRRKESAEREEEKILEEMGEKGEEVV